MLATELRAPAPRRRGSFLLTLLALTCLAAPALAAPTIVQINPTTAAPGDTISITAAEADPLIAANNKVNFLQNGVAITQVAAKQVAPILGTHLAKLTVTLPLSLPPTSRGLTVVGALSLQVGAGAAGPTRPFTYHSQASVFDVSPAGTTIASGAYALLWQGKTTTVTISGAFTNFRKGLTTASFGPGIHVGGGAAGAFGPVTVISATQATASLAADASAPLDAHDMTIKTGLEQAVYPSGVVVVAAGQPTLRAYVNATTVAFESTSGSPKVLVGVEAYDSNGNRVANPAFTLTADPPDGATVNGASLTFTQAGAYNITASATISGVALTATTSVSVLGAPLSPNAGSGFANQHMNSLARQSASLNNLLAAAAANDTASAKSYANTLKTEIGSLDYARLAGSKLLGTNADPNTNYSIHDVTVGSGNASATTHLATRAELTPAQRADDDTYVTALNALNVELDAAKMLYASLDPAHPTQADADKINAESARLTALLDAYQAATPSARAIYDNLASVQALMLQKLPSVSRANSQYVVDLMTGAGLISATDKKRAMHDGVYHPGRDRHAVRPAQFGLILGPLFGAVPFGNVMWKMYSQGIEQIELMLYVLALADLIPTNDMIGITGTNAGLDFCDNVVSINGGVTSIFGFSFSATGNNEVLLIGSVAVKPLYDCINNLLTRLTKGKGPGDPKKDPKGFKDWIKKAYKDLGDCADAIDPAKAKVDRLDPGDPRLGGPAVGIDCNGDFTDETSELSVNGFKSQKTGTFDIVGIVMVRNLDNGLQNILVVDQF